MTTLSWFQKELYLCLTNPKISGFNIYFALEIATLGKCAASLGSQSAQIWWLWFDFQDTFSKMGQVLGLLMGIKKAGLHFFPL